jgi:hypothetical protein
MEKQKVAIGLRLEMAYSELTNGISGSFQVPMLDSESHTHAYSDRGR